MGADSDDPLIGRVLENRYRIVRSLAAGGMGRVYLAEQLGLDRRVAIKVLTRESGDDGRFRERFFREAKLSSKLSHPNTVRVYDYGRTDDDVFFIAMEYLEGRTLGAALKNEGALEPLRAISLTLQVCASLAEAHGMGVVHRDLKPDNLFLTRTADGREFLRVLDFGIAKDTTNATEVPTQAGTVFGSPAYMSPEQILEQDLSPKSDIYSVGAVLYRSLTLRQPHGESNAITAMARHVLADVVPFSVARPDLKIPSTLEWITRQCLSKDPQERFVSATELSAALRACELEIRGLVPKLEPRMERGRMRLTEAQEAEVRRYEVGGTAPAAPARSDAIVPTYVPEPSQSLSHTLRHPAVLVLGGMLPLVGLTLGVIVVLVILLFALVFTRPDPTPTPAPVPAVTQPLPRPVAPPPAQPAVVPEPATPPVAPTPVPAPPTPVPAPVAPAPTPKPTPATPKPKPAPAPAPAPTAPEPAPTPSPAPGNPKSDLRDPFKRGTE
ncbi:MAG: serine/threonine protein kinase [Alphaproteobacteria bacterium]|nr:serine/threonine protein kinase [Alphaproteobacteria bacterium]